MSRVLVCGSLSYKNREKVDFVLDALHGTGPISCIIQGTAAGADALAHSWAVTREVTEMEFVPDWKAHGKAAGPLRNAEMLEKGNPDLVVAFIDKPLSASRGTADMIRRANKAGVPVKLVRT